MTRYFLFQPRLLTDLRQYSRRKWMADLMAGIIVGIVALPLAIAFGIASGVTPEQGIITAIVGGFCVSAFGGSRVQIGGPTGAFIVIVSGIIQQYGPHGLMVATLMAGAFLVLLGLLRLGTVIKYIPYPIVVGFTSGIAVTILTTQVKDFLGLDMAQVPADFVGKWVAYARHIHTADVLALAVGVGSVAIIGLTPRLSRKVPGSLLAIVVMTALCALLRQQGWGSVETIGDRFAIHAALPQAQMPQLTWQVVQNLLPSALTIAVLGAIESLLSATVADGVISSRHDSNQELLGQGVANLCSPLLGGIPVTGAIARTMTNINNGGRTPVAGLVHAAVLLLIFVLLMPLAQYIPMACLAGVLVVVSYNMSGWRTFVQLLRNPKSDVAVLLITFVLTVVFDLTVAIEVGLMLACLLFMKRVGESSRISVLTDEIDLHSGTDITPAADDEALAIPPGVEVYEINGPYFFGVANQFEELMAQMGNRPRVRIIRMRKVPFVDSTGIHNLTNLCEMSAREGIRIVLSGVSPEVLATLRKAGFSRRLGDENICADIHEALAKAARLAEAGGPPHAR